ncbi:MAG: hypothetical protein AAFO04_30240, partial [Cyanobacteria bacterium J06592_8]
MRGGKWVVFRPEFGHAVPKIEHKEKRVATMGILHDHLDSLDSRDPEVGDRPPRFISVKEFTPVGKDKSSTHWCDSDWIVTRIQEFEVVEPILRKSDYEKVFICYCEYKPLKNPTLRPINFGG